MLFNDKNSQQIIQTLYPLFFDGFGELFEVDSEEIDFEVGEKVEKFEILEKN